MLTPITIKLIAVMLGIAAVLWTATPAAHGQKATEMFIPIGHSPGLSNTATYIGPIGGVDPKKRTVTGTGASGTWSVTVTDRTKIWLDRSRLKLSNQTGSFADLKPGAVVEVKYEDPRGRASGKGPAEWVKVDVGPPRQP